MKALVCCLGMFLTLSAGPAQARDLIVSAAASLTDAFSDIEPAFEAEHEGVDVIMNFASSGALYRQIEQGAPADVYASANPKWMARMEENGFVAPAATEVFARNSLVLCTPADVSQKPGGLADLADDRYGTIGIGTPETVPAGQYAQSALLAAGLWETLLPKYIYGESVRQVLDYLSRGEVDAGFVYRTDAVKAGESVAIAATIPLDTPVTYPVAPLAASASPVLAQQFVEFVLSPKGQELLEKRGFTPVR